MPVRAQLGVRRSWARTVLWKQYLWILLVALPVGALAGTVPLMITRALLPGLTLVVPWPAIGWLTGSVLGAVALACTLAMRSLTASEAVGWRDLGE